MIRAIAAGIFLFLIGQSAVAASGPSGVRIRGISFAGSGCPAGSVAGKLSNGFTSFSLYMDDFVAEVGPRVPFSQKRKNCMLSIDLHVPSGWSYSIAEIEYKGYVDIDRGVTAKQTASYYFQGDAKNARLSTTITGPKTGGYKIKDVLGIEAVVWSPCGATRALNVNTQVLVQSANRNASGLITLDRIKGHVEQVMGLRWKTCR